MHDYFNLLIYGSTSNFFNKQKEDASAIQRRERKNVTDRQVDGKDSGKLQQINQSHGRHFSCHHSDTNRTRQIHRNLLSHNEIANETTKSLQNLKGKLIGCENSLSDDLEKGI